MTQLQVLSGTDGHIAEVIYREYDIATCSQKQKFSAVVTEKEFFSFSGTVVLVILYKRLERGNIEVANKYICFQNHRFCSAVSAHIV